jgi:hypothetical protein
MLRRVGLVRTEVSKEGTSIIRIRVTRIVELGTTLTVTSNGNTMRRNTTLYYILVSQKTAFFRYHHENFKSHMEANTFPRNLR